MRLQVKEKINFIKGYIPILLLLFNSFSWYFLGRMVVAELIEPINTDSFLLPLEVIYPISILLSALVGVLFSRKVRRSNILLIWLLFGVVSSLLPAVQFSDSIISPMIIIVILGSSLGFGMPALLSYFTENIPIENRGKIGGLTFFLVAASAPFTIIIMEILFSSFLGSISSLVFFVVWRSWSIPVLLVSRRIPTELQVEKKVLKKTLLLPHLFHNRAFILYFVAWFLFSMVDGFTEPVLPKEVFEEGYINAVELIVAGFSALFAGIVADWIGRKKIIMSGFVSLGIAYAILTINPADYVIVHFFVIVDGFAIGLLWTMFTIVMWGELIRVGVEKAYAVGEAPYFLTQVVSMMVAPSVKLFKGSVFSVASFFLFIAVIPLLYAPETLPEEKIQERQFKIYTEEALKLKENAEQKVR